MGTHIPQNLSPRQQLALLIHGGGQPPLNHQLVVLGLVINDVFVRRELR